MDDKKTELKPADQKRPHENTVPHRTIGGTASLIKDALITASQLTASDQLTDRFIGRRVPRSPTLQDNLQAAERLLGSALEKSSFDAAQFKAIHAETRAELRRILETQQAEALKHSARAKATFQAAIESRRKVLETIAQSAGSTWISPFVQDVLLDTPFLIWPTSQTTDLFFDTYHYEPWNSWAKFKVDSTGEVGLAGIQFYYVWENPNEYPVFINVDSWLIMLGYGRTDIPQHWNDEDSYIQIQGNLSLLEWWNQPPTSPAVQADQFQCKLLQQFLPNALARPADQLQAAEVTNGAFSAAC